MIVSFSESKTGLRNCTLLGSKKSRLLKETEDMYHHNHKKSERDPPEGTQVTEMHTNTTSQRQTDMRGDLEASDNQVLHEAQSSVKQAM